MIQACPGTEKASLFQSLARLFIWKDRSVEFGASLVQLDRKLGHDLNTIRAVSAQWFAQHAKIIALPYFHEHLGSIVNEICDKKSSVDFEIDPEKLLDKDGRTNAESLINYTQKVYQILSQTTTKLPANIRRFLAQVRDQSPEGDMKRTSDIMSLYMRPVLAALLAPHVHGMLKELPSPTAQRALILLTKLLQAIIIRRSIKNFGIEDKDVMDFAKQPIEEWAVQLEAALVPSGEDLVTADSGTAVCEIPEYVALESCATLLAFCQNRSMELKKQFQALSSDDSTQVSLNLVLETIVAAYQ